MKIVIAIDSFKGSMTSLEAGAAISDGIKKVFPDAQTYIRPIADGGEGTVDALIEGMEGNRQRVAVTGPLQTSVMAEYGIVGEDTAVLEMSAAAGIALVPDELRNPMNTTTFGVGEMIRDAIQKGCRNFIIGIGGSATNDGGVGMLQALGFGMLDEKNEPVSLGGKGLKELRKITIDQVIPELSECRFHIACDVTNPLCGEQGCSAIYGPQKGATEEMISDMDGWLSDYAELAKEVLPDANPEYPGAGAAGGIGFAFQTFLGGELKNGISLVLRETRLEDYIKNADYVITGEGRLDSQTVMGKVPVGVAEIAKKYHIPVLAFAGAVTPEAGLCNEHGIDAFFPIVRGICTLEEAMKLENACRNLSDAAEQAFRLIGAVREV